MHNFPTDQLSGTFTHYQAELSGIFALYKVLDIFFNIMPIFLSVLILDANEMQSVPVKPDKSTDQQLVPVLFGLGFADVAL
jgi:hypothetical protein